MQGPTLELKNSVVRAGAGAGKTTGLVAKVFSVHQMARERGLPAPRIVLTTFTRKATQELKERLIRRACEERNADLLQYVSDPSKVYISTIHGLLNTFLKTVGHLAGLDAGFQIIDEGEASHMARTAFRQVLIDQPEGLDWLEVYGFERVLTMCRSYDLARRESGGLTPASFADLQEFAAAEREKLGTSLMEIAARIRETAGDEPKWLDWAEGIAAWATAWNEGDPEASAPRKPTKNKATAHLEAFGEEIQAALKKIKDEMAKPGWDAALWPKMAEAWASFAPFAEEFSVELEKAKNSQGRFEMSDLELKALEILREKPFVASVFSESWDFWMIDEYQDTSPVQVAILDQLIGTKPRYVVGDPQQSIYLFRGAEVRVFRDAEERVRAEGGETIEMMKNYRSQPGLLLWINDFMADVGGDFQRMEPKALADRSDQIYVKMIHAADEDVETRALVSRVSELIKEGARLEEICVLARTHKALMEASRALKAYGYPTHVHSSRGFGARREVLDAQALWKFLVNPHDNMNLILLLRSPWFLVEDWRIAEWMKDKPPSLWRRLLTQSDVPQSVARLKAAVLLLAQTGLARTFEDLLCSAEILDFCLADDPAGRKESNLWKLIHRARRLEKEGGPSILNLLGEAGGDPMESNEGDAASAQEPNCINLMTIHGSKGLEFHHVLVPRMGAKQMSTNTEEFAFADGRFFFPVWDDELGEFVPSPLDRASTLRKRAREMEEYDRWLYVALTRAKDSLSLFWSDTANESWAARVSRFQKVPGVYSHEGYTYEISEASGAEPDPYSGTAAGSGEPRPRLAAAAAPDEEVRVTVTELVAKNLEKKSTSSELVKRWQAQYMGTNLHRRFEALKHQADAPEDEASKFVLGIQDPPMAQLIQEGFTEWGFQVLTESAGVIEGQIDLWGKAGGKIYVVDYKTGSPLYRDAAFEQLSLYAWALRKFGHQEPVELVVIYPLAKKIERREFTDELLSGWENKFGGTET